MTALAIRQVLSPAAPGASGRSTTRTRCGGVSQRPWCPCGALCVPLAEGRPGAPRGSRTRLLHLGGLHRVSDCWRCWLRPQRGQGTRGCWKTVTALQAGTVLVPRPSLNLPRKGQKFAEGQERGVLHHDSTAFDPQRSRPLISSVLPSRARPLQACRRRRRTQSVPGTSSPP